MAEDREEHQDVAQEAPFDANPPVDPSEPRVGNSKARFFMPREDQDAAREGEEEREEEEHGESSGDTS